VRLSEADFSALGTRRVGRSVRLLDEIGSTNTEGLAAAAEGRDRDGLAIFAERQTAGRGRLGRRWHSPRGAGVLCTVVLFEPPDAGTVQRLVMVSGIAICRAIDASTEVRCEIRWPNDVLAGRRKLAGVLVESVSTPRGRAYALGIGINCLQQTGHFPPDIAGAATSLEIVSAHPVRRAVIARQVLVQLDRLLAPRARPSDEELRTHWLAWASPLGASIRLACEGREYAGTVLDIEPAGGLLVQTTDGTRRLFDPATTSVLT